MPKHINIRVSEEVYKALDQKRFTEDTSFQAVGTRLFTAWLEGKGATAAQPEKPKPVIIPAGVRKLARTLEDVLEALRYLEGLESGPPEHVHERTEALIGTIVTGAQDSPENRKAETPLRAGKRAPGR